MNDLQKAYQILGLEPGASLDAVLTRYKRLAKTWHPDRAYSAADKEFHNEELKKINNAKDVISAHFESGNHKEEGACDCRVASGQDAGKSEYAGPGPGARKHANQSSPEAQRQKAEERQRSQEESQAAFERAKAEAAEQALRAEQDRKNDPIKWRVSIGIAAVVVLTCLVPPIARAVHDPLVHAQEAIYADNVSSDETAKRASNWAGYVVEKQHLAQRLLQRPISADDAVNWTAPYISLAPNAGPLSREIASKLKKDAEVKLKAQEWQHTLDEAQQMQNEPKTRSTAFLQQRLQQEELRHKALMQVIQSGAASEDQNKEAARLGQAIDIDKAEIRTRAVMRSP